MYWLQEAEDFDFLSAEEELQEPKPSIDDWIDNYVSLKHFEKNLQMTYNMIVEDFDDYVSYDDDESAFDMFTSLESSWAGYSLIQELFDDYELLKYIDNTDHIELDEHGSVDIEQEGYHDLLYYTVEPFLVAVSKRLKEIVNIQTEEGFEDWSIFPDSDEDGAYGFFIYVTKEE